MARGRKTSLIVTLTTEERAELESWQRSTTMPVGLVRRGRIVLLRADGISLAAISRTVGIRVRFVAKWIERFRVDRVDGLADKPGRGRKPFFPSGRCASSGETGLSAS